MKKVKDVYRTFSAIVWREEDWYVAKCNEVKVTSQGKTKKEAVKNLREALELYFEDEPSFEKLPSLRDVSLEEIKISYA